MQKSTILILYSVQIAKCSLSRNFVDVVASGAPHYLVILSVRSKNVCFDLNPEFWRNSETQCRMLEYGCAFWPVFALQKTGFHMTVTVGDLRPCIGDVSGRVPISRRHMETINVLIIRNQALNSSQLFWCVPVLSPCDRRHWRHHSESVSLQRNYPQCVPERA